jgi:Transglycosylase SLT domain
MTAQPRLRQRTRRGESGAATLATIIAGAAAALLILVPLALTAGTSALNSGACARLTAAQQPVPSPEANSIPRNYLALYQQAGRAYGIPWTVLAGIGKVESDHGRNDGPSSAGALGPMQFLPSTWATYGDGGNIYNPADAIPAAARYLLANGPNRPSGRHLRLQPFPRLRVHRAQMGQHLCRRRIQHRPGTASGHLLCPGYRSSGTQPDRGKNHRLRPRPGRQTVPMGGNRPGRLRLLRPHLRRLPQRRHHPAPHHLRHVAPPAAHTRRP